MHFCSSESLGISRYLPMQLRDNMVVAAKGRSEEFTEPVLGRSQEPESAILEYLTREHLSYR
jgi:hypothetical protein